MIMVIGFLETHKKICQHNCKQYGDKMLKFKLFKLRKRETQIKNMKRHSQVEKAKNEAKLNIQRNIDNKILEIEMRELRRKIHSLWNKCVNAS